MVTPAELVAIVAFALRLPVNSVKNYDRRLMEAGLRNKKGHGRGSALMEPEDASILIAAIAASDDISRAAECVKSLYALPYRQESELPNFSHHCEMVGADQKDALTFGSAFVSVMRYLVENHDDTNIPALRVSITQDQPYEASLIIVTGTGDASQFLFTRAPKVPTSIEFAGLTVTREVDLFVLNSVADMIAGRARLEAAT